MTNDDALWALFDMQHGLEGKHKLPADKAEVDEYIKAFFRKNVGEQRNIAPNADWTNKTLEYYWFSKSECDRGLGWKDFRDRDERDTWLATMFKLLLTEKAGSLAFRALIFSSPYSYEWLRDAIDFMYLQREPNAIAISKLFMERAKNEIAVLSGKDVCRDLWFIFFMERGKDKTYVPDIKLICSYLYFKIQYAIYCEFGFYCVIADKHKYTND